MAAALLDQWFSGSGFDFRPAFSNGRQAMDRSFCATVVVCAHRRPLAHGTGAMGDSRIDEAGGRFDGRGDQSVGHSGGSTW